MSGSPPLTALGLMSGTSYDAVDVALIETDGERRLRVLAGSEQSFHPDEQDLIREATEAARQWGFEGEEPAVFGHAETAVTAAHVRAIARFLSREGVSESRIDVIGFHGQTVLHRPAENLPGATRQLGDAEALARLFDADVVYDFRAADIAAGGQGAPLAPIYHWARAQADGLATPLAVLNLGGVANITFVGEEPEALVGFDTGPANGLLDQWVSRHDAGPFDADGSLARAGRVDDTALAQLLDHRHFDTPPPKSLDRYAFSLAALEGLSLEDGCATLAEFTALSVAKAFRFAPQPPQRVIAAGGGVRNSHLMARLAAQTGCAVDSADVVGWRADTMEAELMAYLAVRSLRGLPITFPGVTGVAEPLTGGRVARAVTER